MGTSLYSLGLKKHHLLKVWSWNHLWCWWWDVGMLHTFKPSYILIPSLGLGAGWDTAGHDMALGLGGPGGMGICTSDAPKILIITVRDQHGWFPSKSWAIDFLKAALNEDGDCVWSPFPQNTSLHVPDEVAEPTMPQELLGGCQCHSVVWWGINARANAKQVFGFLLDLWRTLPSLSLSPHSSFLNSSTLAVIFNPRAKSPDFFG